MSDWFVFHFYIAILFRNGLKTVLSEKYLLSKLVSAFFIAVNKFLTIGNNAILCRLGVCDRQPAKHMQQKIIFSYELLNVSVN